MQNCSIYRQADISRRLKIDFSWRKIKIALIDDGINSFEFFTPNINLNIEIYDNGFINNIDDNNIQVKINGTIFDFAVIHKSSPLLFL